MARNSQEVEIKLRVPDASFARRLLRRLGYTRLHPRVFEGNTVYDTPALLLRTSRQLLRIRTAGARHTLTYKGVPVAGKHKSREELEMSVSNPDTAGAILARLGFSPTFRYEKYRTEYILPGERGIVTIDETPIGTFIELEGTPRWIDRTAKRMGFPASEYITLSYGSLYLEYCRDQGIRRSHMVFSKPAKGLRAR